MAGYTDSEIEAAVARFVKSTTSVERDPLGPIDADSNFNEVVQLISATLIFDPNAIFYLIYLVTNRLNKDVEQAIEYVEDVEQAIQEVGHRTTEVTRTVLLGDASAALLDVDRILTDKEVISSQSFNRYVSSLDRFTEASLEPNIKSEGEIIRPPQKARSAAISTLATLDELWGDVLERVDQLDEILDEFNDLDLAVITAQNSVRKVRTDIRRIQDVFEDRETSKDDKIAETRDAYLSLAAGKAVLSNLITVTDPTDPRLTSTGTLRGKSALPSGSLGGFLPAEMVSTKSAPWDIEDAVSDELLIKEDGAVGFTTYTLTPPSRPSVTSAVEESYDITAGQNDRLEIDGISPTIQLAAGIGRTAAQVALNINEWVALYSQPYLASTVTIGSDTFVKITKTKDGAQKIRMTADDATHRDKIIETYKTLGFFEGLEDEVAGLTAAEAVEIISADGKVLAEVVRTEFENGEDGEITSTTQLELPLNTLASTSHAEDQLVIRSGDSVGYHRIVSVTRTTKDIVTVESDNPFRGNETDVSYLVLRELLKITSKSGTLATRLEIGPGTANAKLGFTNGDVARGTTTGFRVENASGVATNFTRKDVIEGDEVRLQSTTHEVLEVSDDGEQLELDPPLDTGYPVSPDIGTFIIYSAAAVAHEAFMSALSVWNSSLEASDFEEDITELTRVMNPLITNKRPSAAQIGDAQTAVSSLKALLSSLSAVLVGFVVAPIGRMDASMKMLRERDMERGYDILLDGKIGEFFGLDKDDVSVSGHTLKMMREVAREDLPQSKLDADAGDVIVDPNVIVGTDADYDYSDMDTDEDLEVLGESLDLDEDIIA
jgi:uncharacterized protein YoxC